MGHGLDVENVKDVRASPSMGKVCWNVDDEDIMSVNDEPAEVRHSAVGVQCPAVPSQVHGVCFQL